MHRIAVKVSIGAAIAVVLVIGYVGTRAAAQSGSNGFTSVFPFETSFANTDSGKGATTPNPFWVLTPGFHAILEGTKSGIASKVDITVTDSTHTTADGFITRVVRELDYTNGQLIETTDDYLVISRRTNSVYYFGEYATQFDQNGKVTGHAGSWESGVNGAHFGMLMPGAVLLGARFQQEVAPGIALDQSQVVNLDVQITVPAGSFQHCVVLQDTSGLTPTGHAETKVFCPGVGEVQDEQVFLTQCSGLGQGTACP